jgi:uncharacterized protein YwqG
MVKRHSIEFTDSKKPNQSHITKFGGQPVWFGEPQWPISKSTGNPMRFICQIAIDPEIFGPIHAKMAYIFITDEDTFVDGTWEPDGGENAVILQPGHIVVPVKPLATGPTLYRMVKKLFRKNLVPELCEFSVNLIASDDPIFVDENERAAWDDDKWSEYAEALDGNKIGGSPIFLQNTEFPGPGVWKLLIQLNSTTVPFSINLGDCGIGYAFLAEDGNIGKFLWQCN